MSSIGTYLNWRTAAALAVVPSIVQIFILMFFVFETPVYYIKKSKLKQAEKSLYWLWGDNESKVTCLVFIYKFIIYEGSLKNSQPSLQPK